MPFNPAITGRSADYLANTASTLLQENLLRERENLETARKNKQESEMADATLQSLVSMARTAGVPVDTEQLAKFHSGSASAKKGVIAGLTMQLEAAGQERQRKLQEQQLAAQLQHYATTANYNSALIQQMRDKAAADAAERANWSATNAAIAQLGPQAQASAWDAERAGQFIGRVMDPLNSQYQVYGNSGAIGAPLPDPAMLSAYAGSRQTPEALSRFAPGQEINMANAIAAMARNNTLGTPQANQFLAGLERVEMNQDRLAARQSPSLPQIEKVTTPDGTEILVNSLTKDPIWKPTAVKDRTQKLTPVPVPIKLGDEEVGIWDSANMEWIKTPAPNQWQMMMEWFGAKDGMGKPAAGTSSTATPSTVTVYEYNPTTRMLTPPAR